MKIQLSGFTGELPRLDATALPDNAASIATNVDLDNGVLAPLRGLAVVQPQTLAGAIKTLYRYNPTPGDDSSGAWFEWLDEVDICLAPIRSNQQVIACYTGDSYPKITDRDSAIGAGVMPANSYRLGVPAPAFSMVAVAGSGGGSDPVYQFERDYVVTQVCQLGSLLMEGPPSSPSTVLTLSAGQTVDVSGIGGVPTGNYNLHSKRLYRRRVANGSGSYQLVAELPPGQDTFEDTLADTEIPGDVLGSQNWYPPPDSLHSLGALPNGLLYGADGNDVVVSEPYRVHAWNPFARYPCNYPVIGIGQAGNTIVALTAENPFIISGLNPTAMSATELKIDQGCLSRRSIVSGPFGVAYASPDGIVVVNGQNAGVVSEQLWSREQWRDLNPASIIASHLDNRYIFSYTKTNGDAGGYIFDPKRPDLGLIHFDTPFTAVYKDALADGLFVFADGNIQRFEQGSPLTYQWQSKVWTTRPRSFNCGRIEAASYSDLSFTLLRDGVEVMTQAVTSDRGFRLPAGLGSRWQFRLSGTERVYRITIADSMNEL
ncbi:hypothetical protein [Endozoicomonas sp. Mp262]|uniref:hypothetical protein n=1 Tax=Endozoicomonas sp. Mp262 TaxID=2919499 RepID=UPI0021D9F0F5